MDLHPNFAAPDLTPSTPIPELQADPLARQSAEMTRKKIEWKPRMPPYDISPPPRPMRLISGPLNPPSEVHLNPDPAARSEGEFLPLEQYTAEDSAENSLSNPQSILESIEMAFSIGSESVLPETFYASVFEQVRNPSRAGSHLNLYFIQNAIPFPSLPEATKIEFNKQFAAACKDDVLIRTMANRLYSVFKRGSAQQVSQYIHMLLGSRIVCDLVGASPAIPQELIGGLTSAFADPTPEPEPVPTVKKRKPTPRPPAPPPNETTTKGPTPDYSSLGMIG